MMRKRTVAGWRREPGGLIDCPVKRNGSTPAAPVRLIYLHSVMLLRRQWRIFFTMKTACVSERGGARRPAVTRRIVLAFMTSTETSANGWRIPGIQITSARPAMAGPGCKGKAPAVLCAGARGITCRACCEAPGGTGVSRTNAPTMSVSVSQPIHNSAMELHIFKTLWGHTGSFYDAIDACCEHGFDGVEGQAPTSIAERHEFRARLNDAGLEYIAEICTAGSYVPQRHATPAEHLESLRRQAAAAGECQPLFLTVIAGCDAWSVGQSVDFFGNAIAIGDELGISLSFETHRSRSLFNPWTTYEILQQAPALRLTCDFSHWCVVCE